MQSWTFSTWEGGWFVVALCFSGKRSFAKIFVIIKHKQLLWTVYKLLTGLCIWWYQAAQSLNWNMIALNWNMFADWSLAILGNGEPWTRRPGEILFQLSWSTISLIYQFLLTNLFKWWKYLINDIPCGHCNYFFNPKQYEVIGSKTTTTIC